MTAYYNEIDPYAAQWLRNLIKEGHIAPGDVDERSIEDVKPNELMGYTQCHFFAGIGVWSYALRLAGWSDDRQVWTGSCPCQPFSAAGKGAGFADERHLWPSFFHLIKECKPPIIFGEQVASKAVEPWINLVHADVEAVGYKFGCVAFPAASVGAPHIRDRAYWVADSTSNGRERQRKSGETEEGRKSQSRCDGQLQNGFEGHGFAGWLADTNNAGLERHRGLIKEHDSTRWEETQRLDCKIGFWSDTDWIKCTDGRSRPVEPGTFPLAPRTSNHVGRLRAYGNAIVAEAAKEFITAFMRVENDFY